jgi:hypothetical protein
MDAVARSAGSPAVQGVCGFAWTRLASLYPAGQRFESAHRLQVDTSENRTLAAVMPFSDMPPSRRRRLRAADLVLVRLPRVPPEPVS